MADRLMASTAGLGGKAAAMRGWLMTYWRLWEKGYRGPMPYVVGPIWEPLIISTDGWEYRRFEEDI
ncbi:hypothetical protein LCGC14_0942200 [marine sediment metagenome]|uniref:Uncharacterized protein n=1 Tax=marine sediment metagenome TaxID=412755 RepID=A0A0F9DSZ4_9ZZZZ